LKEFTKKKKKRILKGRKWKKSKRGTFVIYSSPVVKAVCSRVVQYNRISMQPGWKK
jgi:hypothetical protein